MSDEAVLGTCKRYLLISEKIDKLSNSKRPVERLQGQQAARVFRFSKASVRQMLFLRLVNTVLQNRYSLDVSCRLLQMHWPIPVAQYHAQVRRHIANRILARLQKAASPSSPSAQPNEPPLTPEEARETLRVVYPSFRNRTEIIGPLATTGITDLATCTDAAQVIHCMWAVHMAHTGAPDVFWRKCIKRLADLHRSKTARHSEFRVRDATATGEADDDDSVSVQKKQRPERVGPLSPMQIFRALRVLKREHWSGDISVLSYLASEALSGILDRFRAAKPSLASSADTAEGHLSVFRAERLMVRCTGLTPNAFISLLIITSELGHRFHSGFAEMADVLLCPVFRTLRGREDLTLVCEMLRVNRVLIPSLYQSVIDNLVEQNSVEEAASNPVVARAGIKWPDTIPVAELVVREIVRSPPSLCQQLQLSSFMHLLLLIAREKRKFSPSSIMSFTSNMYQLHRMLLKTSTVVNDLRSAVDEFAFQLDRLLQHGLVSVNLVNSFLEHRILLGMSTQQGGASTSTYPNMQALLETRNRLYRHYADLGAEEDFRGVVMRPAALVAGSAAASTTFYADTFACNKVAEVYQSTFSISQIITWQRKSVPASELQRLKQLAFRNGVFSVIEASRLIAHLHKENRTGRKSMFIPRPVELVLHNAIVERMDTCGLRPLVATNGSAKEFSDDDVHQRLLTALGAPRLTTPIVNEFVVSAVLEALSFSPLAPRLLCDEFVVGFFGLLVRVVEAKHPQLKDRFAALVHAHGASTQPTHTSSAKPLTVLTPLFTKKE